MAKPASKTKKTIQAKLGSLAKAGTKGKKRSASSKSVAPPISNKQKKSQGFSSNATNLAAATHDNDTDSIVDQDDDHVVLASIPNHSFLSLQALEGEVFDDDLDDGKLSEAPANPTDSPAYPQSLQFYSGEERLVVRVVGGTELNLRLSENRAMVNLLPSTREIQFEVQIWKGSADELQSWLQTALPARSSLSQTLQTRMGRWPQELTTVGQRGIDTDFLSVDTLTLPYENPWKALFFGSGIDFTSDGTGYFCTIHGDVWRIRGIDSDLKTLRWKRFATGLFQPLGLKVRNDQLFVLGRDRITRLEDSNGDGEADFYESFCDLIESSVGGHDYVAALEVDDQGRFYYVDPRGIHRVGREGQTLETLASGWRNPNSLGVSPDGSILTVAPQQGTWTPSSQISEVRRGGYYGFPGPKISSTRPLGYDVPLCWIPHRVDNSSGSQVWLPQDGWGPLGGQMLHLLWGRCGLMLVLRDTTHGIPQGAVVPLPGKFLSGPQRATIRRQDHHLYVAGSTGWQTSALREGCLQRVRYTGRRIALPIGWRAETNGVRLDFSVPLDAGTTADVGSYAIRQWNYLYSEAYGSKDWSVGNPNQEGADTLTLKAARLLPDGKSVWLEIDHFQPAMQIEIKYSVSGTDGKPISGQLWGTVHPQP